MLIDKYKWHLHCEMIRVSLILKVANNNKNGCIYTMNYNYNYAIM